MIHAIHTAVKGRARYKICGLYSSEALQKHLEVRLTVCDGIHAVSASTRTGNVLVFYQPDTAPEAIAALLTRVVAAYHNAADHRDRAPQDHTSTDGARMALPATNAPHAGPSAVRRAVTRAPAHSETPWHCLASEEVTAALETSEVSGLASAAAHERLRAYGANLPPAAVPRSGWSIFCEQFTSLPIALLGAAAGISLLTGGLADAVVIAGVIALNAAIGYVTESQTEQTIHSLTSLVRPSALTLRDGRPCPVQAADLVPGDVLVLRPGSYVAADARLVEAQRLSVDESALTGESLPVAKLTVALADAKVPLADRRNMVYAGTLVTSGQGRAVVVATGHQTEMGTIQTLVDSAQPPETPMQRQLTQMGRQLVLLSGAVCGLVFGIGLLQGYGVVEMLKTSISLAVAAVPEGLPTVATTVLALGIGTMRRHGVLIRHLEVVETLGAVQTLCLDKTGTITLNRMTVSSIYAGGRDIVVIHDAFVTAGAAFDPLGCEALVRLLHVSALCNETDIVPNHGDAILHGSPTENALLHLAMTAGINVVQLRERHPLLRVQHRAEQRNVMSTVHANDAQRHFLAVKGSPDEVLARCHWHFSNGHVEPLTAPDRRAIEEANERMAGDALRVLGMAYRVWEGAVDAIPPADHGLIWLGLVGMLDPVRQGVPEAIAALHQAGLDTIMLTGDQRPTPRPWLLGRNSA